MLRLGMSGDSWEGRSGSRSGRTSSDQRAIWAGTSYSSVTVNEPAEITSESLAPSVRAVINVPWTIMLPPLLAFPDLDAQNAACRGEAQERHRRADGHRAGRRCGLGEQGALPRILKGQLVGIDGRGRVVGEADPTFRSAASLAVGTANPELGLTSS